MSNSAVPLPPVRKSNLVWLWVGIALAIAVAGWLAWSAVPKGVQFETITAGTGKSASDADGALIYLDGKVKGGETFAPKAPFPTPISFDEISNEANLPALTDAFKQMKEGGTYKVILPANLTKDMGEPLGGKVLEFTITLVKVLDKQGVQAAKMALAQQVQAMNAPPSEKPAAANGEKIKIVTIKPGSGPKPTDASTVTVNYVGTLTNGTKFDDGQGIEFPVAGVVPGFAEGLKQMQKGGKYKLTIPPSLGYGSADKGEIPPNSTLVFEVELLDIK